MTAGRLVRVARRLAAALRDRSALAGGLAVGAWGEVRATRDVDFVTSLPLDDVRNALEADGIPFEVRRGDLAAGDLPWVVSGELEGTAFQIFSPRRGRAFSVVAVTPSGLEGSAIPVVGLADLIRLKLEAGGPKDLWDVARLVARHPAEKERAMSLAREMKLESELTRWIASA